MTVDCPNCRVTVTPTVMGRCPCCTAWMTPSPPRMPQERLSGLWSEPNPSERRRRMLDRLWRSAGTHGAVDWYVGLMHTSGGER